MAYIVLWLLDHVPTRDIVISVLIILLIVHEIMLAQELLLVILEFSDHLADSV